MSLYSTELIRRLRAIASTNKGLDAMERLDIESAVKLINDQEDELLEDGGYEDEYNELASDIQDIAGELGCDEDSYDIIRAIRKLKGEDDS